MCCPDDGRSAGNPADSVPAVLRFTFARGNVRKLLSLPAYGAGHLASRVIRRDPTLWAFASGIGVGEGARVLLEHVRRVDPDVRVVWVARHERDVADARRLGIEAVLRSSREGLLTTLRAGVLVVTHGFGDVNRFGTSGALVVQLWHGVPFKSLHLDSPEALRLPGPLGAVPGARALVRFAYRWASRGIGIFAVASVESGRRLRSAFGLRSDQVAVTGDPRDDVLLAGAPDDLALAARSRLADLLGDERLEERRTLLYAPTWRDGAPDPAVPSSDEWARIAAYLDETDSLLLVRSHPLGAGSYAAATELTDRVLMLGADVQADVTPLLPAVDVLVTDYSSIALDFALLGRPVLFLAPDAEEYVARRGAYEPYAQLSGGSDVPTWDELLALLTRADADDATHDALVAHARALALRFHDLPDGQAAARVYDEVRRRLAGLASERLLTGAEVRPGPEARADDGVVVDTVDVRLPGEGLLDATADGPALEVGGAVAEGAPSSVEVVGSRWRASAPVTVEGDRWWAHVPLLSSRWGGPALPPPSGTYRVAVARDGHGPAAPRPHGHLVPRTRLVADLFGATLRTQSGQVVLHLAPPLRDDERGTLAQARWEAWYRRDAGPAAAAGPSVFFESFSGRNASCNPRGIDRALAREHPDVTRFWSVVDASVEVPPGAVAVVEGSREWWAARSRAQVLVVNDWLRKRFRARPGQTVLQTWHGTPLKRIALMRPGLRPAAAVATWRESGRWDVLLAQNPFAVRMLRRSYAFRGKVWQDGYPRNDVLSDGAGVREAVRERLGLADDVTAVLYAPTWRDDRLDQVDHLDVARLARTLGPRFVILVRGHARTLAEADDVLADGVLDVSTYPEISELFLASDALVTDYSSVMFDFCVTGRPMLFFVPDLADYRDRLRGFTFDLLPVAPGPVVDDADALADHLRDLPRVARDHADRYDAWRSRFAPRDDGRAGERVVRRLRAEGRLRP